MSDLISRQAAIDAVSKGCEEWRGIFGRVKDIIDDLPSAEPKWIPVTERLPEEDGDYIVAVHYITLGKLTSEIEVAFFDSEIWEFYDYTMSSVWCEVVAWMPLPEPFERAD